MPKSPAQAAGITLGHSTTCGNSDEALDAQGAWQAHVHAGRIGQRIQQTPEQRIRHARNEMIVCGYHVWPGYHDSGAGGATGFKRGFLGAD